MGPPVRGSGSLTAPGSLWELEETLQATGQTALGVNGELGLETGPVASWLKDGREFCPPGPTQETPPNTQGPLPLFSWGSPWCRGREVGAQHPSPQAGLRWALRASPRSEAREPGLPSPLQPSPSPAGSCLAQLANKWLFCGVTADVF